jgi:DNA-binding transcriptional LysR family regulator
MYKHFQRYFDKYMSRLSDLSLFLKVVDVSSISAAARSLGISPALASKRLQNLENELGVRLLHRTTRKVSVTPEGRELLQRGRQLIEDLEGVTDDMVNGSKKVSGTLRITTGVSFGRLFISPLLSEFLKQHPALKVQLHLSDENVNLIESGFDMAIRISGGLENSGLIARKIMHNRRILCASPAYLAENGTPQTLDDLNQHNCLVLTGRHDKEGVWQLMDSNHQEHKIQITGTLESNLGDALYQSALSGLGISLHSDWHVRQDMLEGRLIHVLPEFYKETAIYVVMPQRQFIPLRVRSFTHFIESQLSKY